MTASKKTPVAISVVIPAYNEAHVIAACLEALVPQLAQHDEIILVDNNSTDDTITIARSLFSNIRIIKEVRQGITYARTRGFNEAKNSVIARIDADTIVGPGWLDVIRRNFNNPGVDALCGSSAIAELSPSGRFWHRWFFAVFRTWHQRRLGVKPVMYGHNSALRQSLWRKIRHNMTLGDDRISEDLDVTLSAITSGATIVYDSGLVVKCHILRTSFDPQKLRRYLRTDNYTLAKYNK